MEYLEPFEIVKFHNADELNLLLNFALQLKSHYFNKKQNNPFSQNHKKPLKFFQAFSDDESET